MKQIKYILMLLVMAVFAACDSDSIEGLSGEYNNINFCTFTTADVQPTQKLGKGIKALNAQFTDAEGHNMTLSFGSKEWILGEGTYSAVTSIKGSGTYAGSVNGAAISEGDIDVSLVGDVYFVNGLVKTTDGKEYKASYKGPMTFIVGEDDPEPSGYTMSIYESQVSIMDWTTFQQTVYPDVTKYTIIVNDPTGKQVGMFDAINGNGKKGAELAGVYTIISDAHEAMQIGAGYSLPEYGMAGGTSYLDDAGNMQYLTGGSVEITTAKSADGETLYSFKGIGLVTIDAAGVTGSGAFNFMFISLSE